MKRRFYHGRNSAALLSVFACVTTGLVQVCPGQNPGGAHAQTDFDPAFPLCRLPSEVVATIESRDRALAASHASFHYAPSAVLDDFRLWNRKGETVTVAFLGGDNSVRAEIVEDTKEWTAVCNIKLDFGNAATGYRSWTTTDKQYVANIRVSFDQDGYFSLVGRDCIDPTVGRANDPVGGRCYQRTLNLSGIDKAGLKPPNMKGIIRHEFGHALGFQHEHQRPQKTCEQNFRWTDDPGYKYSRDAHGMFVSDPPDADGHVARPGIYTYLSGYPNYWPASEVDANMRALPPQGLYTSPTLDQGSIMLYDFPAFFYTTNPSPCAYVGDGDDISSGDAEGLGKMYPIPQPNNPNPAIAAELDRLAKRQTELLRSIVTEERVSPQLKESLKTEIDRAGP